MNEWASKLARLYQWTKMRRPPRVTSWHHGSPRPEPHQRPQVQKQRSFQQLGRPQNLASSHHLEELANGRPPPSDLPGACLKWSLKFSLFQNHEIEGMTQTFFSLLHALILEPFARMQTKGRKPFSPGNGLPHRIFLQWKRARVLDSYFQKKSDTLVPNSFGRSWACHCNLKVQEVLIITAVLPRLEKCLAWRLLELVLKATAEVRN